LIVFVLTQMLTFACVNSNSIKSKLKSFQEDYLLIYENILIYDLRLDIFFCIRTSFTDSILY